MARPHGNWRGTAFRLAAMMVAAWILPAIDGTIVLGQDAELASGQSPDKPVFSDQDLEFFEREIRPLLSDSCWECHSGENREGGLRLDYRDGLLRGGDSGPAVILEDPDSSLLMEVIGYEGDYQMPPDSKLPDRKIAMLTDWVKRGLPWPNEALPEAIEEESFDLASRRAAHWCWQAPVRPEIPTVRAADWPLDPIDQFVLSRLESAGLRPASDADRATWLRRVTFDLTGLPPTVEQVQAFLADQSPEAHATVVDRLLASPQFGEHWARRWMDLTRYAETYGHEFDYPIEHAYQYRDYLIRAFNDDVPYDQFVQEHIAGDLLNEPRRNPSEQFNESLLGTGFWFLGEGTHGPVDVKGDEAGRIDNQIDVMTKTFLGLTVSCARCHDHKFDAISTKDYYAMSGFLQSSRRQLAYLDPGRNIETQVNDLAETRTQAEEQYASWFRSMRPRLDPDSGEELNVALALLQRYPDHHVILQGESMQASPVENGVVEVQSLQPIGDFRWQGNQQIWWREGKIDQVLTLDFPVAEDDVYEVFVNLTKASDYAVVEVWVDGHRENGRELDCYDSRLTMTGDVSLGCFPLSKGTSRLKVRLAGTSPESIPRMMFGLDYLSLKVKRDGESQVAQEDWLAEQCAARSVSAEEVRRWEAALRGTKTEPNHPLFALRQWADAADRAAIASQLQQQFANADQREAGDDATRDPDSVLFCDFSEGALDGWSTTGWAFGTHPATATELAHDGVLQVRDILSSATWGTGLQGTLRSPTFELTHDQIHHRLRGANVQIRLVVDGFMLDTFNALLFNGMTVNIPATDEFQWFAQGGDIRNYRGHRAYLEINDLGDGWVELDEIRFSNRSVPSEPQHPLNQRLADVMAGEVDAVGPGVVAALSAAVEQEWASIGERPSPVLNWLLQHQLEGDFLEPTVTTKLDHPGTTPSLVAGSRADTTATNAATVDTIATPPQPSASWRQTLAAMTERSRRVPRAMPAIAIVEGSPEDEFVFIRGSHRNLGDPVPRRSLEALREDMGNPYRDLAGSGRREFARELIDPRHPLTSRVMVNRLWHHLFGRGIVASTDNFGELGETPTHPELLDYLALEFIEDDWSLKQMLKRLVLTRTYRLSSQAEPSARESDPDNLLLHSHTPRRLTGEEIRDAILQVSGELDTTMYGPSVPVHLTPFMQGRGRPGQSGPLDGKGRRSVYLEVRRNFLNPMMLAFDTPIPFNTQGRRNISNVPAQALILMNDPFVIDQARKWVERVLQENDDPDSRIASMIFTVLGRPATEAELASCREFLVQQAAEMATETVGDQPDLWADLAHVLFNVKSFVFVD